jgi:hypothetical protein
LSTTTSGSEPHFVGLAAQRLADMRTSPAKPISFSDSQEFFDPNSPRRESAQKFILGKQQARRRQLPHSGGNVGTAAESVFDIKRDRHDATRTH